MYDLVYVVHIEKSLIKIYVLFLKNFSLTVALPQRNSN